MDIFEWVAVAKSENASDLHLAAGSPPMIRVKGDLMRIDSYAALTAEEVEAAFSQIATPDGLEKFKKSTSSTSNISCLMVPVCAAMQPRSVVG